MVAQSASVLGNTSIVVLVHTQLLHWMAQQYLNSTTMNVQVTFNFRARIMQIFTSRHFVERRYLLDYVLNITLHDVAICIGSIN